MTYFPMGAIDASKFNSTKYPGVCKPMDVATLQIVYDLQNQLNRLAKMIATDRQPIAVDGDIGPGTVSMATRLGLLTLKEQSEGGCMAVAQNADSLAATAKKHADELGAPVTVPSPSPSKPPTIITAAGLEIKGPPPSGASLLDSFKNLDTTTMLALGVVLAGGAFLLLSKPKGAAPSKPRIRYRTRHRTRYITRRSRR